MKTKNKAVVGIRVSVPLVQQIIKRMNWSPAMPFNYAVDSALRELLKRLEEKGETATLVKLDKKEA